MIERSVEVSNFGIPLGIVAPPAAGVVTSQQIEAFMATQTSAAIAGGAIPPPGP